MKCTPVTQKAKSSPFKMNAALVQNDAQVHKGFVDVAGAMGDGMDETQKRINASKTKQEKPAVSDVLPVPSIVSSAAKPDETLSKTKKVEVKK